MTYVCEKCGSERVSETCWRNINTQEVEAFGLDGPFDHYHCNECMDECRLRKMPEPNQTLYDGDYNLAFAGIIWIEPEDSKIVVCLSHKTQEGELQIGVFRNKEEMDDPIFEQRFPLL